jgi:hypothetical protein
MTRHSKAKPKPRPAAVRLPSIWVNVQLIGAEIDHLNRCKAATGCRFSGEIMRRALAHFHPVTDAMKGGG